jgi:hypothetical protein
MIPSTSCQAGQGTIDHDSFHLILKGGGGKRRRIRRSSSSQHTSFLTKRKP